MHQPVPTSSADALIVAVLVTSTAALDPLRPAAVPALLEGNVAL